MDQETLKGLAPRLFRGRLPSLAFRFMDNAAVKTRHFCLPPEELAAERSAAERADLYVEHALDLSARAANRALDRAGLGPKDVDRLVVTSTTGEPTPSLDTRLQLAMGLPLEHTRPRPARGHGCAGGAEELGQAADWARAHPGGVALLVSVELCGLAFQPGDVSRSNLVAASLFADGAAAVVLGTRGEGPEVLGDDCVIWPDTGHIMGWRQDEKGVFLILDKGVPSLVRGEFRPSVDRGLERLGLEFDELRHFLMHPGGPAVIEALEDVLKLERGGLKLSRGILEEYGNMSSATVLFILERFLQEGDYRNGDLGLISAMGPGFRAEHVFIRC